MTKHMTKVVAGKSKNGIRVPSPGGLCHQAWKVFDELTAKVGRKVELPTKADAMVAGRLVGLNRGNLEQEFPRWKRFNGFTK